jgi:predicted ATPase
VGESRALVVHGEPGAGKTVLLDYLAGQPGASCRLPARPPASAWWRPRTGS